MIYFNTSYRVEYVCCYVLFCASYMTKGREWQQDTYLSLDVSKYRVAKPVGPMKITKVSNSFEITFMLIWGDNCISRVDDLTEAFSCRHLLSPPDLSAQPPTVGNLFGLANSILFLFISEVGLLGIAFSRVMQIPPFLSIKLWFTVFNLLERQEKWKSAYRRNEIIIKWHTPQSFLNMWSINLALSLICCIQSFINQKNGKPGFLRLFLRHLTY